MCTNACTKEALRYAVHLYKNAWPSCKAFYRHKVRLVCRAVRAGMIVSEYQGKFTLYDGDKLLRASLMRGLNPVW